ncbi:Bud site selection protein 6 [Batrachochytrium dendrobatidis]|nr:Bud site selection protein 6 [Batrachochytrium dendrobatidis]KAK5673214.1 Bud site selection protein 6 [Batrachochytrium dendrobatidis]
MSSNTPRKPAIADPLTSGLLACRRLQLSLDEWDPAAHDYSEKIQRSRSDIMALITAIESALQTVTSLKVQPSVSCLRRLHLAPDKISYLFDSLLTDCQIGSNMALQQVLDIIESVQHDLNKLRVGAVPGNSATTGSTTTSSCASVHHLPPHKKNILADNKVPLNPRVVSASVSKSHSLTLSAHTIAPAAIADTAPNASLNIGHDSIVVKKQHLPPQTSRHRSRLISSSVSRHKSTDTIPKLDVAQNSLSVKPNPSIAQSGITSNNNESKIHSGVLDSAPSISHPRLTLFLQCDSTTRKATYIPPLNAITLRTLFSNVFTHIEHIEDYDIYIRHPTFNEMYLLEDVKDIHDGSVLKLVAFGDLQESIVTDHLRMIIERLDKFETNVQTISPVISQNTTEHYSQTRLDSLKSKQVSDTMRKLKNLRSMHNDLTTFINTQISEFALTIKNTSQLLITSQKYQNDSGISRIALLSSLDSMGDYAETFEHHLNALRSTVDTIRVDLTRGVQVTLYDIHHLRQDIASLSSNVDDFCHRIVTDIKSTCKSTWEKELQRIVDEQQFVKDQEAFGDEMGQSIRTLDDFLTTIEHVVKTIEPNMSNPNQPTSTSEPSNFISHRVPIILDVMHADEAKTVGIQNVLAELEFKTADLRNSSERRVAALHQMGVIRPLLQKSRKLVSRFEKELGERMSTEKLRLRVESVMEVEQKRQKKDWDMITLIYSESGEPLQHH